MLRSEEQIFIFQSGNPCPSAKSAKPLRPWHSFWLLLCHASWTFASMFYCSNLPQLAEFRCITLSICGCHAPYDSWRILGKTQLYQTVPRRNLVLHGDSRIPPLFRRLISKTAAELEREGTKEGGRKGEGRKLFLSPLPSSLPPFLPSFLPFLLTPLPRSRLSRAWCGGRGGPSLRIRGT